MDRLISEQAVLDILRDYYRAWFLNDKNFMDAVNAIKAIPSAKPCEDAISREKVLKVIDTWDKFGYDANTKLVPYQDHYIAYIHDVIKNIKTMPSVKPQEPKTGYISIDDVMSVFDDFMCGEVDEDGTETFLEMLKDKAERSE